MDREYAKKLARSTMVSPYLRASTAETGAQVIILGHNHLDKVGLNISCLHRTRVPRLTMIWLISLHFLDGAQKSEALMQALVRWS